MKKVLILCTGNSCRSQMAEGYLRKFAGDKAGIFSAGVEAHGLNQKAVEVMREDGIDISAQRSKVVDEFKDFNFDFIITVCDSAREKCPYFPGSAKRIHQDFPDPAEASGTEEEIINQFRSVRNLIREYVRKFSAENL